MGKISKELNEKLNKFFDINKKEKKMKKGIINEYNLNNIKFDTLYRNYLAHRYYDNNKKRQKVKCECGQVVLKSYHKKHLNSKKQNLQILS